MRETAGDQAFVRPGLWESKVTIEKFDMPGMPPEMAQRMKTMMAQNQEHDFQSCLTPEDVKRPKEDFFAGKNNKCRYDHFTMGGGKIDAAMHCGGKDGERKSCRWPAPTRPTAIRCRPMDDEGRRRPRGQHGR